MTQEQVTRAIKRTLGRTGGYSVERTCQTNAERLKKARARNEARSIARKYCEPDEPEVEAVVITLAPVKGWWP